MNVPGNPEKAKPYPRVQGRAMAGKMASDKPTVIVKSQMWSTAFGVLIGLWLYTLTVLIMIPLGWLFIAILTLLFVGGAS